MEHPVTVQKDLRAHVATMTHQKWIILSAVVLTLGTTIFLTMRQTPAYTSEGQLRVSPVSELGALTVSAGTVDMPTERYTVTSVEIAQQVADQLGQGTTAVDLQSGLSVNIEPDTEILNVGFTDPTPARAQTITQTFMDTYLKERKIAGEERIELKRIPLEAQLEELKATIARLEKASRGKEGPNSAQAAELAQAYFRINEVEKALSGLRPDPESGGRITIPADLPTTPSSPDWGRNIALAIMLGLAFGLGVAILRENMSEGLKGSKDLEEATGAPVLAAVPQVTGWRRRSETQLMSISEPKGSAAEAYRTMRTNLQYIASMKEASVFALSSATLGEGKSTTSSNLAVTIAQTGKRVIAVSCDLRKPRLHRFFGLSNDVGVTSILAGDVTLAEAAQRPEGIEMLRVLASGPVPSNPAELLGSPAFDQLLDELRLFADIVLIDTPPILAVSDTLIIGPKADGVILVADAHSTSKGAVEHTREQLEQVGADIVGCVFNNFDPGQAKYYPYDKRYYYSGYYSAGYPDEIDTPVPARTPPPQPEGGSGGGTGMWG